MLEPLLFLLQLPLDEPGGLHRCHVEGRAARRRGKPRAHHIYGGRVMDALRAASSSHNARRPGAHRPVGALARPAWAEPSVAALRPLQRHKPSQRGPVGAVNLLAFLSALHSRTPAKVEAGGGEQKLGGASSPGGLIPRIIIEGKAPVRARERGRRAWRGLGGGKPGGFRPRAHRTRRPSRLRRGALVARPDVAVSHQPTVAHGLQQPLLRWEQRLVRLPQPARHAIAGWVPEVRPRLCRPPARGWPPARARVVGCGGQPIVRDAVSLDCRERPARV